MTFKQIYEGPYIGAGIVFVTPKKEILLLKKRNNKWTFPGGHREDYETQPIDTAKRECKEEIGFLPEGKIVGNFKIIKESKAQPIHSFFMLVKDSFMPILSYEHKDYKWVHIKRLKEENLTSVFKPYWKLYKKFIINLP